MKKKMNNSITGPINSDLDLMWVMTNMYLEGHRSDYKDEIEDVIRTTHNFVLNNIERKDLAPEMYAIVKALVTSNPSYFKENNFERIERSAIETVRGILSTLRQTQSYT